MISTGITGTARQGMNPNSASMMRVNTLARSAPPRASNRLARAAHVIRVNGIADHLQREIGLDRRADVEIAVAEQRPAAVFALDAAQIDRDLGFERGINRLAEVMPQQHIFGRNGGVGFELEHPMAVGALAGEQRLRRFLDVRFEGVSSSGGASIVSFVRLDGLFERVVDHGSFAIMSAARLPDRIAPSMVAGKPVSVQSPARTRLRHFVAGARPFGVLRRRGGEGRAPLAHDLPRVAARPAIRSHARPRPRSSWRALPAARR